MSVETIPGTDIRYGLISFDKDGRERDAGPKPTTAQLIERATNEGISDVFFFCHGWKGDVPAARDQYNRWMGALMSSPGLQRANTVFPGFKPLLIGLHWPSLPWGDEDVGGSDGSFGAGSGVSGDKLLKSMLAALGDEPAIRVPLETLIIEAKRNAAATRLPPAMTRAYMDLNKALGLESKGVEAPPDADREGFDPEEMVAEGGDSFGDLNLGGVLGPLRQLSYWTMKKRARSIGEGGMHSFLTNLQRATAANGTRIHLMGHSFGTVVISSMLGGPNASGPLVRPVDSVALVQGAVSLWCYASKIPYGKGGAGYFNRVLTDNKVKGPLSVTISKFDKAVGVLYPFASKINGSASFDMAVNKLPEYGAIGAFGIQGSGAGNELKMLPVGGDYGFAKQRIYNIESSQFICHGGGAAGAHSDIAGPEVAQMIWQTAFASK
jgi:hypothetical protein